MLLDYYTDDYFTAGSGTRMQPKLHMSTVVVYWVSPSMISGGRYQCVTRRSVYLPPHLYSIARAIPKSAIFAVVLKKKTPSDLLRLYEGTIKALLRRY